MNKKILYIGVMLTTLFIISIPFVTSENIFYRAIGIIPFLLGTFFGIPLLLWCLTWGK